MPSKRKIELNDRVFINCAFDEAFLDVFRAMVFAVKSCGFMPRTALDSSNSGETRIDKIAELIVECDRGIHDLSAVDLDKATRLPRFNMPLELGLTLGARRFGNVRQRAKRILIMDQTPHQYDVSTSDISGQDIAAHGRDPAKVIGCVRNWLAEERDPALPPLPGGLALVDDHRKVRQLIDAMIVDQRLDPWPELTHRDYLRCVDAGLAILGGA